MVDAHSELMTQYPWGFAGTVAERERERARQRRLRRAQRSCSATPGAAGRDRRPLLHGDRRLRPRSAWPATTGPGPLRPVRRRAGAAPPTQTPAPMPSECDDGPFGHGTGGQLRYDVNVPRRRLDHAVDRRRRLGELGRRGAQRVRRADRRSRRASSRAKQRLARARSRAGRKLDLPGDRAAAGLDRVGQAEPRRPHAGRRRTSTSAGPTRARSGRTRATWPRIRWIGAGFPDYPWLFARRRRVHRARGGHARPVRRRSRTTCARCATSPTSSATARAWSCTRSSPTARSGSARTRARPTPTAPSTYDFNTDEIVKFPGAVALIWRWTGDDGFRDEMLDFTWRNLEYVRTQLDDDGDGWPEGNGNVERPGMGAEKLDNAVYYIRGLYDFADMARSAGQATRADAAEDARRRARARSSRTTWWIEADQQYADSLRDPGNVKVNQKHWIGVDPMEAELYRDGEFDARPGRPATTARAALADAREQLLQRRAARQPRPVPHRLRRRADGRGRVRDLLAQHRHPGRRRGQLRPPRRRAAAPLHGRQRRDAVLRAGDRRHARRAAGRDAGDHAVRARPTAPRPGTPPNIDRCWTCRSMFMQAWGHYGTAWAVVHQQLGVRPHLGHDWLEVVPQVPDGQPSVAGRGHPPRRRLGRRARVARRARATRRPPTRSDAPVDDVPHRPHAAARLDGRRRSQLDGAPVTDYESRETNRGLEVRVPPIPDGGHTLVVDDGASDRSDPGTAAAVPGRALSSRRAARPRG